MNFNELKTKKSRIAYIKDKLGTDYAWAVRGLVRVYYYQTTDEQQSHCVDRHNGVGFTRFDADILSSYAEQVLNHRELTPKQQNVLFHKMPKYASQLEKIAK